VQLLLAQRLQIGFGGSDELSQMLGMAVAQDDVAKSLLILLSPPAK
jgi:hypothetical protein